MGKILSDFKVAFMGQTGRGKSTLINAIFGTNYPTNSVVECTTFLNCATLINNNKDIPHEAVTIIDTPGIGASLKKDKYYKPYYLHALEIADCIVWITNMERTDYADQTFFRDFKQEFRDDTRLVVCINHIDKFTPQNIPHHFEGMEIWDNMNNCPTPLLKFYIEDEEQGRMSYFKEKFSDYIDRPYEIVATNAFTGYNIETLKDAIWGVKK